MFPDLHDPFHVDVKSPDRRINAKPILSNILRVTSLESRFYGEPISTVPASRRKQKISANRESALNSASDAKSLYRKILRITHLESRFWLDLRRSAARKLQKTDILSGNAEKMKFDSTRSVAFSFESHLPTECAIHKEEVAQSKNHPNDPPGKSHAQPVMSSSSVIDGQVVGRISARRQHHRIERESRPDQHAHDIQGRSGESDLLRLLDHCVHHDGKRAEYKHGDDESDGMGLVVIENARPDGNGRDQSDDRQEHLNWPDPFRSHEDTAVQIAFCLRRDVKGSMRGQRHQRDHAGEHRIPVEDAVVASHAKIRPERLEEILVGAQRHAAHNVAQRRPKEDAEQRARSAKNQVKKSPPHGIIDVRGQFDADAAQHQQPQHHHQGQIETTEARGIEQREGKVERSARGEKPDFVAVPDRANRADDGLALCGCARRAQINDAGAKIESIEYHIGRDHESDNSEPESLHISVPPRPGLPARAQSHAAPETETECPAPYTCP